MKVTVRENRGQYKFLKIVVVVFSILSQLGMSFPFHLFAIQYFYFVEYEECPNISRNLFRRL